MQILSKAIGAAVALSALPAAAEELNVPANFPTIQSAIEAAVDGDEVVVEPGTYLENLQMLGKAITVRSTAPDDPAVVGATVLDAGGEGSAVRVIFGERRDTVLDGLTIRGGDAGEGGGISIFASDPLVQRCVFTDNVGVQGGAVYAVSASPQFLDCRFEDNQATDGGAAYLYACSYPRFDACVFTGNTAEQDGGAIAGNFNSVRLYRCEVADNSAGSRGGAYFGNDSRLIAVSTLVRDNVAPRGGAIYADEDAPRLRNSTIVGNVATTGTGGVIDGFFTQPILRNSIVRDNGPDPFAGFSVNPYIEYSNVEGVADPFPGTGTIDLDPLFVDPAGDDYRLQPGSPSVDAGFDGWVASYALEGLGGQPRIQDDGVDMGAYELEGDYTPPAPIAGQLLVGLKDDGNLAYGLPLPLLAYDEPAGAWSVAVRNLPAFAIGADDENECLWVQNGETGLLCRVPYDDPRPQEIGVLRASSANSLSLSGFAVVGGELYATTALGIGGQAEGVYRIDTESARCELVGPTPTEYDLWDLEAGPDDESLLLLSSAGYLPGDLMGVYELDLVTFEIELVQQWINDDPINEAPALQGLAVGADKHFLLRPLYNDLEVYDADSLALLESLSLPVLPDDYGQSWVLGGLTWKGQGGPPEAGPMMRDARGLHGRTKQR